MHSWITTLSLFVCACHREWKILAETVKHKRQHMCTVIEVLWIRECIDLSSISRWGDLTKCFFSFGHKIERPIHLERHFISVSLFLFKKKLAQNCTHINYAVRLSASFKRIYLFFLCWFFRPCSNEQTRECEYLSVSMCGECEPHIYVFLGII